MSETGAVGVRSQRSLWSAAIALALVCTACSGAAESPTVSIAPPSSASSQPAPTNVEAPDASAAIPGASDGDSCDPGRLREGLDLNFENIINAYNTRSADRLIHFIGNGPVVDPSLTPGRRVTFADVTAWLAAADNADDELVTLGYGYHEPFELHVTRTNSALRAAGIKHVTLTLLLWAEEDCGLRVESGAIVSSPDPCRYEELFGSEFAPECQGPFDPRAHHAATWTGDELLIVGGVRSSGFDEPLQTGLSLDPETGAWRQLAPAPLQVWAEPAGPSAWTGDELIVAGVVEGDATERYAIMRYSPATDTWQVGEPFPVQRYGIGGLVWTGTDVIVAGGSHNQPATDSWAYSPHLDEWRMLPEPGWTDIEGPEGVWTGKEAIFFGGYEGPDASAGRVYDPAADSWRPTSLPAHPIQFHDIAWTGTEMIVYSGHSGPEHPGRLLIYDPAADVWRQSPVMPIEPTDHQTGVWTGDELIIWGGLATYGRFADTDGDYVFGDGAAYDPVADKWRIISEAPLSDRCLHTATWTGSEMIIFGGMADCGGLLGPAASDAAAYDPISDTWRVLAP